MNLFSRTLLQNLQEDHLSQLRWLKIKWSQCSYFTGHRHQSIYLLWSDWALTKGHQQLLLPSDFKAILTEKPDFTTERWQLLAKCSCRLTWRLDKFKGNTPTESYLIHTSLFWLPREVPELQMAGSKILRAKHQSSLALMFFLNHLTAARNEITS